MAAALEIIGIVFGSNGLFMLLQYVMNNRGTTRRTLAAVSYSILSDKLEMRLDSGYATPEQRREMGILIDAYKANGWNGDMDERIKRFYALPTKKCRNEGPRYGRSRGIFIVKRSTLSAKCFPLFFPLSQEKQGKTRNLKARILK